MCFAPHRAAPPPPPPVRAQEPAGQNPGAGLLETTPLQESINRRCVACHVRDVRRFARGSTHAPVRSGSCGSCHLDHGSENRLILQGTEERICGRCHDLRGASPDGAHRGFPLAGARCTECHDPHGSEGRGLVRPVRHAPFADNDCGACHGEPGRGWRIGGEPSRSCAGTVTTTSAAANTRTRHSTREGASAATVPTRRARNPSSESRAPSSASPATGASASPGSRPRSGPRGRLRRLPPRPRGGRAPVAGAPYPVEQCLAEVGVHPIIYVTSESHHSFIKIARMAGLGTKALHQVPVTQNFVLDVDALARQIEIDVLEGWMPLMVVGTAGTSGAGLIDPLPQISGIADRFGLWFHVDAAWGGSAVLSPELKPALAGIERADSVTWDAHKWLSVPMGAGMFFCRHPEAVKRAFAISTSYMPKEVGEGTLDPYPTTMKWSRRMIGLKVFMTLAELGLDGYRQIIEHQADMGDLLRERLRPTGWLICNQTPLPVVCFSHPDIRSRRLTTEEILATIYARGRVWISEVILGGQERVLRACITSYHSDKGDIECLVEELEQALRVKE